MYYFIIIILVVFIIVRFRRVKIKIKTFFRKGFAPRRGKFGVYCYCGKQGSGKTYSAVEFLLNNPDLPIYSNVATIKGINYTYFQGFNELLNLREEMDCIIFFDEIFTALSKKSSTRLSKEQSNQVMDFLSQTKNYVTEEMGQASVHS